jgi:hypothetical protein
LVEVTTRTIQGRRLLRPSPAVNELVAGVLGRAQRLYGVEVCAFVFVSSHYHLLARVADAKQLARFMRYLNSNLARKVGRLAGWRDRIWSRRYQAIVVSSEEAAQVERLRYLLSHGVKEGLVESVRDWPGVSCVQALTTGETVKGYWFDQTQEYAARRRGEDFDRYRYANEEELTLSPLPCWADLSDKMMQQCVAALIAEIEAEAAAHRRRTGSQVLGASAVRGQHPFDRPSNRRNRQLHSSTP